MLYDESMHSHQNYDKIQRNLKVTVIFIVRRQRQGMYVKDLEQLLIQLSILYHDLEVKDSVLLVSMFTVSLSRSTHTHLTTNDSLPLLILAQ